jgi:hypothetical protein
MEPGCGWPAVNSQADHEIPDTLAASVNSVNRAAGQLLSRTCNRDHHSHMHHVPRVSRITDE